MMTSLVENCVASTYRNHVFKSGEVTTNLTVIAAVTPRKLIDD